MRVAAAHSAGLVVLAGQAQPELVPVLAKLAGDPQMDVRLAAVQAIKQLAKGSRSALKAFFPALVPALMERVKDRTAVSVKLNAERALLYLLEVKSAPAVLEEYGKTLDNSQTRSATLDYCKRVVAKLPDDSDAEDAARP